MLGFRGERIGNVLQATVTYLATLKRSVAPQGEGGVMV
jgi:hypothetical protein